MMRRRVHTRWILTIGSILVWVCRGEAGLPGTFDPAYAPILDGPVRAIAVQPDGQVLIGGAFRTVNGVPRSGVARLNPDGTLDPRFAPGTGAGGGSNATVNALLVQSDGKVLLGGDFTRFDGVDRPGIVRLEANGRWDAEYLDSGNLSGLPTVQVLCLAALPGGKALVGGRFSADRCLVRLTAAGTIDPGFAPTFGGWGHGMVNLPPQVRTLRVLDDGRMLVQGFFCDVNNTLQYGLVRLRADGRIDPAFHDLPAGVTVGSEMGPPSPAAGPLAVGADGCLVVGSNGRLLSFPSTNGSAGAYRLFRLDAEGNFDGSFQVRLPLWFGYGSSNAIRALLVEKDGRVVVSADFIHLNGESRQRLARLNRDGGLDYQFASEAGTDVPADVIAQASDGSYLLGGSFAQVNGVTRPFLARLHGDAIGAAPPAIVRPPAAQSAQEGERVTWAMGATGPGLCYQWQFKDRAIPGATNAGMMIARVVPAHAGQYSVVISNAFGCVTSAPVTLTVHGLTEVLNAPPWSWTTDRGYDSLNYQALGSFAIYDGHLDIDFDGQESRAGWWAQTNVTHDGGWAAQFNCPPPRPDLAPLAVTATALLRTSVAGPGVVSFWWKLAAPASQRPGFERLTFQIGTGPTTTLSADGLGGDPPWQRVEAKVPAGTQVLTWTAENNRAFLDEVSYLPTAAPRVVLTHPRIDRGFRFEANGQPGERYQLERSEDLRTWTPAATVSSNGNGTVEYLNPETENRPALFYRLIVR